jgi:hypothetical protein
MLFGSIEDAQTTRWTISPLHPAKAPAPDPHNHIHPWFCLLQEHGHSVLPAALAPFDGHVQATPLIAGHLGFGVQISSARFQFYGPEAKTWFYRHQARQTGHCGFHPESKGPLTPGTYTTTYQNVVSGLLDENPKMFWLRIALHFLSW